MWFEPLTQRFTVEVHDDRMMMDYARIMTRLPRFIISS